MFLGVGGGVGVRSCSRNLLDLRVHSLSIGYELRQVMAVAVGDGVRGGFSVVRVCDGFGFGWSWNCGWSCGWRRSWVRVDVGVDFGVGFYSLLEEHVSWATPWF